MCGLLLYFRGWPLGSILRLPCCRPVGSQGGSSLLQRTGRTMGLKWRSGIGRSSEVDFGYVLAKLQRPPPQIVGILSKANMGAAKVWKI